MTRTTKSSKLFTFKGNFYFVLFGFGKKRFSPEQFFFLGGSVTNVTVCCAIMLFTYKADAKLAYDMFLEKFKLIDKSLFLLQGDFCNKHYYIVGYCPTDSDPKEVLKTKYNVDNVELAE